MATLKLETKLEISVPAGVKVISNGEWITLAKKDKKGTVGIFTCLNSEIFTYDLNEEKEWLNLSKDELEKISKM
jgi:hypothetical protein